MRPEDPGADVLRAIVAAHDAMVASPLRRVAAAGFPDVTPAMLAMLVEVPVDGIGLADLRRSMGGSKQNASQMVEQVRRRGYVDVVPSAADGRAKPVVPTGRGRALREAGLEADRVLARVASDVMGEDASDVAELLLALAARSSESPPG